MSAAGPAGLAAALAAGRAGARVILCEEDVSLGGRLLSDGGTIDGMPATDWVARAEAELRAMPNVRIMTRTTVTGAYDHGTHAALERVNDHVPVPPEHQPRQRLWRIVAKRTVVAAGALERPIVFGGNDVPGVMLASAMRTYLNRYAAAPAKRVALFTNNDDGWKTVDAAVAAGLTVAGVVDARAEISAERRALAAKHGFAILNGVVDHVAGGKAGIGKIEVALAGGARAMLEADGLAVSGGWNPSVGLTSQHRGRPKWRDDIAAFVPDGAPAGMVAAGAANGTFSLAQCLSEGHAAGATAAADLGFGKSAGDAPSSDDSADYSLKPLWHVTGKKKAFVDFQNDVTASDVALAALEGFESVEHLKRYTTLGMATDQGKNSNVQGLAIMAELTGRSIPRDRHDDLPPALCADRHRRAGRPSSRREFPFDAPDAVASLGGRARRDLRRHRPLEARAMVSVSRREGLAGIGDARGEGGQERRRLLRRLDARQDRRAWPGRRRLPRPRLHQHLLQPRRRQGPLRADAARGRHRL